MSGRISLLTRGAFTTPMLSVFLIVVIAALSYLGATAPTLLADGRTSTIQRSVTSLPPLTRWPAATVPGLPEFEAAPEADTWGPVLEALERQRQEQPDPLRGLLGAPRLTIAVDPEPTSVMSDHDAPVPLNKVGLVADTGLADRADLVEGRLPEVTGPNEPIEVVLTEAVAEQLEWPMGTARNWDGATLELTGLVTPSGRDDGDWAFISGSDTPLVEVSASGDRILVAAAFLNVDETAPLVDRVRNVKISSWMPFDTAALDTATAQETAAQLRLLTADPLEVAMYDATFFDRGLAFSSALPQTIDEGVTRGDAMTAVVTVAAVGPIAVALVVLALVSRLIAVRRVVTSRMLRARGASVGRLIALLGSEGAVLGVLGAAIGAGAAAVTPGWAGAWVLVAPVILAAVPTVVLPWSALTDAERRGRSDLGEKQGTGSARAALQLLILAVTAVLAVLIIVRGRAGGADPLLLALPVLLGGSGSILSLHLLPVLLRFAERRAARRRSLEALLGPARARRDPVVRTAPVLGVVVGLGVAVFSVAFAATVSEGITRSAEMSVGADARIDAAYITDTAADRIAAIDGVASTAAMRGDSSVDAEASGQTERATMYAVDSADLAAVQQGAAAPLPLPAALAETADEAVPVVVSEALLSRLGIDDPDDAELEVAGTPVRVVATAPSQVPFGTAEQWVIVDAVNAAALGERGTGISQLYLSLTPDADPDAVGSAAVAELGGDAAFETPAGAAAVYEDDPAFGLVQRALAAASALVAVLLAVAVIATLVLGAPSRARMLAILRTLGHPNRAAGRLVAWEVAPALLLALPFGVGAGIAMAWLVIPQLDLRGFVGGTTQPPVALGGALPLLVVAGFALVTAVAVIAATALASRVGMASTIRTDDEERGH
ncbi:MAG: FtsX-like permease family protein [Microbacterium sp.]